MQNPDDSNSEKQSIHQHSMDETTESALSLLKGLNPLQAKADEDGFGFLSYLLRMAILEAQAIASGSSGDVERVSTDTDDSFEVSPPGKSGTPSFESRC